MLSKRGHPSIWTAVVSVLLANPLMVAAKPFAYENITDRSGGPGQGNAPSINDRGDIAFYHGTKVYFYDRGKETFLDVTALPGAPASAWFPKLNNLGNIAMIEPGSRNLWLFESQTQAFTNLSSLPGYPGNSQAHGWQLMFDLNDSNKVSFHSGDLNYGQVYVYDHATSSFEMITGKPGGAWRGRENAINNAGQVAYMGFPSLYLYDPANGTTTNISELPGGPGGMGDSFAITDRGDAAIFRPAEITYYDASSRTFLYLSTLVGFPAGSASSYGNDLSPDGITFWRTNLYFFDPTDQSFTQLNNNGSVPVGGMETSINANGLIAMAAGLLSSEDIFLAIPLVPADFDADKDVDATDLSVFRACFSGPAVLYDADNLPPGCGLSRDDSGHIPADFDKDGDVDQSDFGVFQRCYSGTKTADSHCSG